MSASVFISDSQVESVIEQHFSVIKDADKFNRTILRLLHIASEYPETDWNAVAQFVEQKGEMKWKHSNTQLGP